MIIVLAKGYSYRLTGTIFSFPTLCRGVRKIRRTLKEGGVGVVTCGRYVWNVSHVWHALQRFPILLFRYLRSTMYEMW
jgi:calcineurin-like phosphoesterase